MQQREKILAAVFAGTIGVFFGLPVLESTFLAPLKILEEQEIRLTKEKKEKFASLTDLARKDVRMREWRARSLPKNSQNAVRLYQEWVTNLALLSGIDLTKVTPEPVRQEGGTFSSISVKLVGKAKMQELALFLERFNSVDLLHRITRCYVETQVNEGDPELQVEITAEGAALATADDRLRLFDQTELAAPLEKSTRELKVASSKGFPASVPFLVRIGEEFLNVTEVKDNVWTVQRGVGKTFSSPHQAGEAVEYFPVRPRPEAEAATVAMWSHSLFTKPSPAVNYDPKLVSTTPPPAIRGRNWTWTLEVTGWNPAFGTPTYSLINGPEKMEIDERKGTLKWTVSDQVELGDHPVQVLVWGSNGKSSGITPTVNVRVRNPNEKPVVEQPKPLRFFIGRESRFPIKASDPDGTPLKFSLTESPAGMTIDAATGEIRWTPPQNMAPAQLTVAVQVADSDETPEIVSLRIPAALEEDSARFTYLTGRVRRNDGVVEAWLHDRITGRATTVHEGDNVSISDLEMKIEKILDDHILVDRFGQRYRIDLGVPLVQMRLEGSPAEVRPAVPPTAATVAPPADPKPEPPAN
ncbi:putative Ig domain-containing protein [Planctomicrobium sp. SH664]|uniref:putative Ig domain-containing protein n=1 Tax=Planctomicrobium sp. SH664 TaxID=3448125 RepID=UPI003F5B990E